MNNLTPKHKPTAPLLLKENVINRLKQEEKMKKSLLIRRVSVAAAVVAAIAIIVPLSMTTNVSAQTKKIINSAVEKLVGINNYIVRFNMRTTPNENFATIDANEKFVDGYFEKSFDAPYQWKISKRNGRTALYDGDSVYMWLSGARLGFSMDPQSQDGVLEEFARLLDPSKLLQDELALLASDNLKASIDESGPEIVLVVESEAQGDFTNDYARNTSIPTSDSRRTYVFDKESQLLKSFCVDILSKGRYVTVVKSESITYGETIDWTLELKRPDIEWQGENEDLQNVLLAGTTAVKAVSVIFSGLEKSNIEEVKEAFEYYDIDEIKDRFFGVKVISIGESFKSGLYPGEYVPIEVKLKDGKELKMNVAVRNDNANGVWVLDGGI